MNKLTSEWAVTPTLCALCKQHREKDEYCVLVTSLNETKCVVQKKTANSQFIYVPTQTNEPVMQSVSLGYNTNIGPFKHRADKQRYIKIKRFGKTYRHRVNCFVMLYGKIYNDKWLYNLRANQEL